MKNAVQWCPDSRYYTDYPRLIAPVIRATDHWPVENFDLMLEVLSVFAASPLLQSSAQSIIIVWAAAHFHLYQ